MAHFKLSFYEAQPWTSYVRGRGVGSINQEDSQSSFKSSSLGTAQRENQQNIEKDHGVCGM